MKEIWPNFFIVGAIRGGTTSLYEYLKEIPSIYMSSIKEPNYFAAPIDENLLLTKPIRDKKKYLKLFKDVQNETAIGEASPTYLWDPKAAQLIRDTVPNARIIMILRDPVERAFSHYLMLVGNGSITSSFEQIISYSKNLEDDDFSGRVINAGFYSQQVKRYLDSFPRNQIKIFIFEEFIKDTKKSVQEVLDFLNVNGVLSNSINTIYNQFTIPRGKISSSILKNKFVKNIGKHVLPLSVGESTVKKILGKKGIKPELSESTREILKNIYSEDITKLEKFLGRSIPWCIEN